MSDQFRRVAASQPINRSAARENAIIEAVESLTKGRRASSIPGVAGNGIAPSVEVFVKNASDADLPAGGICTYYTDSNASLTFTDANLSLEPVLSQEPESEGDEQSTQNYLARRQPLYSVRQIRHASDPILITSQPISTNAVGKAVVAGVAVCKVYVSDLEHRYAEPVGGDPTYLQSAPVGPVRILGRRRDSDSEYAIGYQSCLVLLTEHPTAGTTDAASRTNLDSIVPSSAEIVSDGGTLSDPEQVAITIPPGKSVNWQVSGGVYAKLSVTGAALTETMRVIAYLFTVNGNADSVNYGAEVPRFSVYALDTHDAEIGDHFGSAPVRFFIPGSETETKVYMRAGLQYDGTLPGGCAIECELHHSLHAIPVSPDQLYNQNSQPSRIIVSPSPPPPPTYSINVEVQPGTTVQQYSGTLSFTATLSTTGTGAIPYDKVTWDFGNGNSDVNYSPNLYATTQSYDEIGFFTVTATATVEGDFSYPPISDSVVIEVVASPPPPPPPPPPPNRLTVGISPNPTPTGPTGPFYTSPLDVWFNISISNGTPPYTVTIAYEGVTSGSTVNVGQNIQYTTGITTIGPTTVVAPNTDYMIPVTVTVTDSIGDSQSFNYPYVVQRNADGASCPFAMNLVINGTPEYFEFDPGETKWFTVNKVATQPSDLVVLVDDTPYSFDMYGYNVCGGAVIVGPVVNNLNTSTAPGVWYISITNSNPTTETPRIRAYNI